MNGDAIAHYRGKKKMKKGGKMPKDIYNARKRAAIKSGRAKESDFERMYGGVMQALKPLMQKSYSELEKSMKKKYGGNTEEGKEVAKGKKVPMKKGGRITYRKRMKHGGKTGYKSKGRDVRNPVISD